MQDPEEGPICLQCGHRAQAGPSTAELTQFNMGDALGRRWSLRGKYYNHPGPYWWEEA